MDEDKEQSSSSDLDAEIDLNNAKSELLHGLRELINKIASDKELQGQPLLCYNEAMKLAKNCYGKYSAHPLVQAEIQTYLSFVQTCILIDMRNSSLGSKKK